MHARISHFISSKFYTQTYTRIRSLILKYIIKNDDNILKKILQKILHFTINTFILFVYLSGAAVVVDFSSIFHKRTNYYAYTHMGVFVRVCRGAAFTHTCVYACMCSCINKYTQIYVIISYKNKIIYERTCVLVYTYDSIAAYLACKTILRKRKGYKSTRLSYFQNQIILFYFIFTDFHSLFLLLI